MHRFFRFFFSSLKHSDILSNLCICKYVFAIVFFKYVAKEKTIHTL